MRSKSFQYIAALLFLAPSAWPQDAAPGAPSADPEPQAAQSRADAAEAKPATGQLILPAGSWIKVRVDDVISSDRNTAGDYFTGTIAQPVIVDGYVIARRGQNIEGRVVDAQKAGRAKGTSRLAIQVTEIALADGRQVPIRTQMIEYAGGKSNGEDVAKVGAATGLGAMIGAAADGGKAAGIGAAAGAAAATIGVLATRGRATVVYPESVITFRTTEPITIDTTRATHAFNTAQQGDYEARTAQRRPAQRSPVWGPGWGGWGGPGWGGPGWGGPGWWGGYPGWYGTSVIVYSGGRYHRRWR